VHDEIVRLLGAPDPRPVAWAIRDGALPLALRIPAARAAAVVRAALAFPRRRPGEGAPAAAARRLALILHAATLSPAEAQARLARAKFSRSETRDVVAILRFIAAAFSDTPPLRVLYPQRAGLPPLLRAAEDAARGKLQRARVRALRRAARHAARDEAPVDGRDLARWLDLAPGPELGRWLEIARAGWYTRAWRTRDEVERALLALRFDPVKTLG
jgi:hypothetical protein